MNNIKPIRQLLEMSAQNLIEEVEITNPERVIKNRKSVSDWELFKTAPEFNTFKTLADTFERKINEMDIEGRVSLDYLAHRFLTREQMTTLNKLWIKKGESDILYFSSPDFPLEESNNKIYKNVLDNCQNDSDKEQMKQKLQSEVVVLKRQKNSTDPYEPFVEITEQFWS